MVLGAILRRETEGKLINSEAVRRSDPRLYEAACRHFSNWRNALQSAGIRPDSVSRLREWTPTSVQQEIVRLCSSRRDLKQRSVARHSGGLVHAAIRFFRSWPNALETAGVKAEQYCQTLPWDRERILEAILLRAVKHEPLGSTTVRPYSLKRAASDEFGSWTAALEAAGLNPRQHIGRHVPRKPGIHRESAPDGVKKAILQRSSLGLPIDRRSVTRQDRKLLLVALAHFRRWADALEYAGIDPKEASTSGQQ